MTKEDAARIGFELKNAIDDITIKEKLSVRDCAYMVLSIVLNQLIIKFGPALAVQYLVIETNHILDLLDPLPNNGSTNDMN